MVIPFDPADPYPLLPLAERGYHQYKEEQTHSERVDAWLGLDTEAVEAAVSATYRKLGSEHQLWLGLPVQSLLTPYTEIRTILTELDPRPGDTIVDLGAAYGRIGLVMGRHWPQARWVGYEFVVERVKAGQEVLRRQNCLASELHAVDLSSSSFTPPAASAYFIYDYGTRSAVQKTLADLKQIARSQQLTVVGRGRGVRDSIERKHPWLSQVVPPLHHGTYSIYRTR